MHPSINRRLHAQIHIRRQPHIAKYVLRFAVYMLALLSLLPGSATQIAPARLFIVQAASSDEAAAATTRATGIVSRRLGIIGGVSAWLDAAALHAVSHD